MSHEASSGFPELTELGKQLEVLRIERGLSKQALAKKAGTSRQQLWRVMTGKSELTAALKIRLADALQVPSLTAAAPPTKSTTNQAFAAIESAFESAFESAVEPRDLANYLADPAAIERTLRSMPTGDVGRSIKRGFLDLLEDRAMQDRHALDAAFFDLRRKVVAGEL